MRSLNEKLRRVRGIQDDVTMRCIQADDTVRFVKRGNRLLRALRGYDRIAVLRMLRTQLALLQCLAVTHAE